MSDNKLIEKRDELLEAVKAPARKKTPGNNSLYFALIAADFIFAMLDIGSGLTVYWLTDIWFYGVLVFLAGILPLLLHQKLFTRAYASQEQKNIAIAGALLAVFSILFIGILAGIANVKGVGNLNAELTVVLVIVVLAFIHAIILTWYFYTDEGIHADQTVEQTLARAIRQATMIEAGDHVLDVTNKSVQRRQLVAVKYGSRAALAELLRQMGWDENENGIPDFLEKQDKQPQQMRQFAADTKVSDNTSQHTLADLTRVSGKTAEQIRSEFPDYDQFAAWCSGQFDAISGKNMRRIYYGEINPTREGERQNNGRR
jgi:hypothetical protein